MKTENENRKVVIVSANMCANEANKLYGDRYGYDWIYPTVTSFKTAKEVINEEFEKSLPTDEISEIYIRAMEEYASQLKHIPSSTVDLESGRQTTSQKGLEELIVFCKKVQPDFDKAENYQHGFHDSMELVITKATELLTQK